MPKRYNWKIAGAAGHGVKSIGSIMARALLRHGWYVFGYDEYPSLIRGGHNTYQLLISDEMVTAPQIRVDMLLALNEMGVSQHLDEIDDKTVVIKDQGLKVGNKGRVRGLPILEAAKKLGNPLVQNTILLGVTAECFELGDEVMRDLIKEEFGKKEDLLALNYSAYEEGRKMAAGIEKAGLGKRQLSEEHLVMTGSESAGMGAISAGLQAYFAYPMTPSSPLLHFLAEHQADFGYFVRQPEDEIGAINMAIGASFTGARAMVGTAGGGFALMQEAVALAGIVEVPLVIYVGMRPGPATGLPTWSSQADLRFVIHSGHGEFPKIVLTPGDTTEAFEMVRRAFEWSQKYQVTVIVLSDKILAECHFTSRPFDQHAVVPLQNIEWRPSQPEGEFFTRYQATPDGIGKRTLPGIANGFYIANSDEHDSVGIVDESSVNRNLMIERRRNKGKLIESEALAPTVYGKKEAEWYFVSWGSTKGSILEAMKQLPEAGFCHFTQVWPLSQKAGEILAGKRLVLVENNTTAQFGGLLRQVLGIDPELKLLKDDGRPFYPEEIVEFVKKRT